MPEQIPITLRVGLEAPEAEKIIVRFVKDYMSDAGRERFVVGVSGGLDSAVSAALAVRAVGAKNVFGMVLPDGDTPKSELTDASAVLKWLGLKSKTLPIDSLLVAARELNGFKDPTTVGNEKARFRMILLHAEAASRRALVLGTGNKSESLTGYFSKHGDGGVDLQPIGDLYKTQVRILAKHLGVPKRILTKAPTAGLWAGQTDEKELGVRYDDLDRILLGLELKLPFGTIAKVVGVKAAEVERVESMRRNTQHKRRMALAPKLGLRTVGVDWRTPTMER